MQCLGIDIGGSSVKLAGIDDGQVIWTAQSGRYTKPTPDQLIDAIREAAQGRIELPAKIGICVPGLVDRRARTVTLSINVPGLIGIPLDSILSQAFDLNVEQLHVVNDAYAAAVDVAATFGLSGRVLALALGTGVGASLLEDGKPMVIEGDSPGHLGQMDVSLESNPPVGPDGGAGSLEAYLGVPAIVQRYGTMEAFFQNASSTEPPMLALVRAIRICHAIYRPQHVVLVGGVGIRLAPLIDDLKRQIDQHLTSVARWDWMLRAGETDFHAAIGAARLAG